MQTINCDVCRKRIDDPMYGRTMFYFAATAMCEACRDALDLLVKPTIRRKDPFAMDWYSSLVVDSCEKGVQKGKI
jgi:hypothetical protein